MPLPIEEIKKLIKDSIPDASIEIEDLMGDNNHYSATITSSKFNNLSKIDQHKLVYKSLISIDASGIDSFISFFISSTGKAINNYYTIHYLF